MSEESDYSPVATRYRDFSITPVLSNMRGAYFAHSCRICGIDGAEIFRVEVNQICPDWMTAHAVAIGAGMRRIDEILGPEDEHRAPS